MKEVPLVVYEGDERVRKVIGTAVIHEDGRLDAELTSVDLSLALKTGMVFGASLATFRPQGCTTEHCGGDMRYAAPGRGHIESCRYPLPDGWLFSTED